MIKTTKEMLEQYCANEREIQNLQNRVDGIDRMRNGLVENFLKEHLQEQKERTVELMKNLQTQNRNAEEFVFGIQDSLTRRIFTLRYLEGKKQQEIAEEVHIDRSGVSRRIRLFWTTCTQFT